MIDTTWGSIAIRALQTNPSTGVVVIFVALALIAAVVFVVINLAKNTELTKAILAPHKEMADTVALIRADQVLSNEAREGHSKRLTALEKITSEIQADIHAFKCSKAQCPNRENVIIADNKG